jgi:uncharacterized protein (TIGR02996 family)
VLANADALEPRLVFADWLVERGDPRGEFILVQCALGRPLQGAKGTARHSSLFTSDPPELKAREGKLLKRWAKAWLAPIRPFIRTWRWDSGFVVAVVADTTKFLEGRAALFGSTPLVDVELTAMKPGQLKQLSTLPEVARLRRLNVGFQKLDAVALEAFSSPGWAGLRSLRLAGNRFGVAGATVLAKAPLPALEALELNDAYLDDECVEALVAAPFFPRLKSLELGWNQGITGRGCELVLRRATSLERLRIRGTGTTADEVKKFAGLSATLTSLHVSPQLEASAAAALGSRVEVTA